MSCPLLPECCCTTAFEGVCRTSQAGDVIYIEANSGAVKRVGRCDAYATEFDLEAEEYVPLPKVCCAIGLSGTVHVIHHLPCRVE